MAILLDKVMTSASAAVRAWRTFGSPSDGNDLSTPERRRARFALLAGLYDGTGYVGAVGERYREAQKLYGSTRQIGNTAKALCDFYAGRLYAGPLSPDGERTIEGHNAALPLVPLMGDGEDGEKRTTELRRAFGQLSADWWAWDIALAQRVKQTAILGSLLTEVVDDPKAGKIMTEMIWPGVVEEMTLDASGNVKGYVLEYKVQEPGPRDLRTGRRADGDTYLYRKVVTPDGFWHYRDDRLVREDENPYGFVPAVWDRHGLSWGVWGEPAIAGSQTAVDEINELWSHANDRLHQQFAMPVFVGNGAQGGGFKRVDVKTDSRDEVAIMEAPGSGTMGTLELKIGEVLPSIEAIMDAIAIEIPEIKLYERIREMAQITGPGIRRAVTDVEDRVNMRAALYDKQAIKILQMGTAIAGWRLRNGDWGIGGALTEQQMKFAPYGLDSYKAGQLDAMMLPRKLVAETYMEQIQEQQALELLEQPASLETLGLTEDEVAARLAARSAGQAMLDTAVTGIGEPDEVVG